MKVILNRRFSMLGTDLVWEPGIYQALPATNQPNWKERRAVFVIHPSNKDAGLLLDGGEYEDSNNSIMSELHYPNGRVKRVKNLGWLLRNWKRVARARASGFELTGMSDGGCRLVAHLHRPNMGAGEPHSYVTDFASLTVCWSWLHRPVFVGTPCVVRPSVVSRTVELIIGSGEWVWWESEFNRANTAARYRDVMVRLAAI